MDDVNPRVAADPTDLEALATKIHDMLRANPASSPAHRALHARGHLVGGTFTPSGAVGDLTAASVLTGGPVDVVARFSDASGDPNQHDARPDGRGLAVKLRHPDGTYDLVGVTSPAFVVRDGASFVEALEARRPDPATGAPDPARMMAFLEAHPEAGTAVGFAMSAPVPASFATLRFNGLHTFLFVGPDGARHPSGTTGSRPPARRAWPRRRRPTASRGSSARSWRRGWRTDRSPSTWSSTWGRPAIRSTIRPRCGPSARPGSPAGSSWPRWSRRSSR